MEEGSVLTSNVPDVRIEEFQTFVAPDVRVEEFQVYRTEVVRKTGKMREWTESLVSTIVFVSDLHDIRRPGDAGSDAFNGAHHHGRRPLLPRQSRVSREFSRGSSKLVAAKADRSAAISLPSGRRRRQITTPFVKRVIGLPGDIIEVKNREVYLNGELRMSPTRSTSTLRSAGFGAGENYGPITVPADQYFVMGDNRDNSSDSRFWGFVDRNSIIGKPLFVYWSYERHRALRHKRAILVRRSQRIIFP